MAIGVAGESLEKPAMLAKLTLPLEVKEPPTKVRGPTDAMAEMALLLVLLRRPYW